jgi:alpha-D-xyloside xylohydrolase
VGGKELGLDSSFTRTAAELNRNSKRRVPCGLLCMVLFTTSPCLGEDKDRLSLRLDRESGIIHAVFRITDGTQRDEITIPPVKIDDKPFADHQVRIEIERSGPAASAIIWSMLDQKPHDLEIAIRDNSAYYGCGERFGSLNHKGLILPMVSSDHPEDKGVVTYKPVPFYMSTRGYALWLDSFAPGTFDLNASDRDHVLFRYRASRLRLVLMDGPDVASMLNEFTQLTGRPRVPPAWSFAPWKSRNIHNNREELLADAELTRRHDLPGSVIVLDSPWETGYNDFVLNQKQFSKPEQMFARIRELGFCPCLWLTPFVNVENLFDMDGIGAGPSGNFAEGARRGFFVKQPDGAPMIATWWKGRGALVDFTNPAAVSWWHEQIDQARRWGFRALKCDDGEGNFVQDAVFFDGTAATEMKNRYATLYLKAAQDYIDKRLSGDGVLLARCGFTGTQQQPFCWAGDNEASFSFENGLPSVILAGQNAALSGIPFYGHDIAGYIGTQTPELFIRWTQFGALSPMMQVHMTSNLGPWDFGDEALSIYRKFAKLHTSLFPYMYDAAHEAARSGMPIIRPMVLAFPKDPDAAAHRYQYLFGPDLLVAPMYQPGTHRSVYLPRMADGAKWIDYWTGKQYETGQLIEAHAPLDRIPLYVRGGAMIWMVPEDVDTLIPRNKEMSPDVVALDDRRVLEVWPGTSRSLTTFEGISAVTTRQNRRITLTVSSNTMRPIEIHRMFPSKDGLATERDETSHWTLDSKSGIVRCIARIGPTPATFSWSEQ